MFVAASRVISDSYRRKMTWVAGLDVVYSIPDVSWYSISRMSLFTLHHESTAHCTDVRVITHKPEWPLLVSKYTFDWSQITILAIALRHTDLSLLPRD